MNVMNTGRAPACVPTWRGHIETTKDALIIFEACFTGALAHCFRRPHDRERNQLIVSGNVFVYEEATSGIKRWTDGIPWSPSRILTNFLIYRQLNCPFPPGEKKRANKRGQQRPTKPGDPYPAPGAGRGDERYRISPVSSSRRSEENLDKDADRGLLGSLVTSYAFKEGGLVKKTMTVVINHVQHHLVSYYSLEDAKYNLRTPRDDPRLQKLRLRDELLHQPKFKFTNFDDAGDGSTDPGEGASTSYAYYHPSYDHGRQLSTGSREQQSHQESSNALYQGIPPSSQAHTPAGMVGYSTLPSTSTTYMPMTLTMTGYSPPHHHHAPEGAHGAAQSLSHSHPDMRHLSQGFHSMPSYQAVSQLPAQAPSHHGLTHHLAYDGSLQTLNIPPSIGHGLPRTTLAVDYISPGPENYTPVHEYYSAGSSPLNEHGVLLPSRWHGMQQPLQSRMTTASTPLYRAQS